VIELGFQSSSELRDPAVWVHQQLLAQKQLWRVCLVFDQWRSFKLQFLGALQHQEYQN